MASKAVTVLQLRVTLCDVEPPIWRRFLVNGADDLAHLHHVLQEVMGWTDTHLHMFVADSGVYGVPDLDFGDDTASEEGVRIDSILQSKGDTVRYEYDFGDDWEHEVTVEAVRDARAREALPRCLAGERACPPEDVGGGPGYEDFLATYADETDPEHEEMVEWVGDGFDPEWIDIEQINAHLKARGF